MLYRVDSGDNDEKFLTDSEVLKKDVGVRDVSYRGVVIYLRGARETGGVDTGSGALLSSERQLSSSTLVRRVLLLMRGSIMNLGVGWLVRL